MNIKVITVTIIFMASMLFLNHAIASGMNYGIGTLSCGQYVKTTRTGTRYQRENLKSRFSAWLSGYFTALSVEQDKDLRHGKDIDALNLWVDNYCKANPLKNYYFAVKSLMLELNK